MRKIHTTGNTSFSFLDLLFGSLGAVVVLLIITLSIAGPPERIRDHVKRTIEWKIITKKDGVTNVKVIKLPNAELFSLEINDKLPEQSSLFILRTKKITLNEKQSEYTFSLVFRGDDDEWDPSFDFFLELSGKAPFELYSASVTALPGEKELSTKTAEINIIPLILKYKLLLLTRLSLYDKDRGKMPKVEELNIVNDK
jgi:hypothetical protein